jgi:predicted dehydrogenase
MRNASKKIRVALVGCGDIAEKGHLPALLRDSRFEIAAVCDVNAERAALLARQAGGVPSLTNHRELVGRAEIDAAILAMHPYVSVDIAIEFLRQGHAVLDEKPLAATLEDGRRLAAVVEETKGVYQIGFVFRYIPLVKKVAEIARAIGTPAIYGVEIYDERLDRSDTRHFSVLQTKLSKGSVINYEGSHVLDYFQQWNPSPWAHAAATAIRTEEDYKGPNAWDAQLRLRDGSVLHLEISWGLPPPLPGSRFRIAGPRGWMELDLRTACGRWAEGGVVREFQTEPMAQAWQQQLDVFHDGCVTGTVKQSTVQDGLRALVASKACERARETGTVVEVEAP